LALPERNLTWNYPRGTLLTLFWNKPAGVEASDDSVDLELVDESGGVVQCWQLMQVRAD